MAGSFRIGDRCDGRHHMAAGLAGTDSPQKLLRRSDFDPVDQSTSGSIIANRRLNAPFVRLADTVPRSLIANPRLWLARQQLAIAARLAAAERVDSRYLLSRYR